MKKLMTMIAAVGMAFGLYATTVNDGTGFEGATGNLAGQLENLSELNTSATKANYWDLNGLTTEAAITAFVVGESKYPDKDRNQQLYVFDSEVNNNYLALKTNGKEVTRYALDKSEPYTVDSTIWFDSLVKLTAFDQDPEVENAKLALYLRDKTEDETPAAVTNLMIKVGTGEPIVIGDGSALLDTWARVTIKAVKMNANQMGFVVFIDKEMVTSTEFDTLCAGFTVNEAVAISYKNDHALIPFNGNTISGVSFQGQGSVDDLVFTTDFDDEGFAADPEVVKVTFNTDYAAGVSTNENGVLVTTSPAVFPAGDVGAKVWYKGAGDYLDGWAIVENGEANITTADLAAAKIGDVKYKTLQAAATAGGNIVLLKDVEETVNFSVANTTLDLNGAKTITGGVTGNVILDNTADGMATIEGAYEAAGSIIKTNIKFSYELNNEFDECTISKDLLPTGYEFTVDDEQDPKYWLITKIMVAQIGDNKYESLQAAIDAAKNGDTVKIIAAVSNEAVVITGPSTNDYAITLQNDASVTWTADAGTQKYGMKINGAKVTFTGTGSWTKESGSASLIQAGASLPAAVIVESGTFVSGEASKAGDKDYKTVSSNAISSKWGSIVVNGGSFINYRGDQGRCVRAEGTKTSDEAYPEAGKVENEKVALYATLVVNGGEFTVVCPDGHSESTLGITAHHVAVDNKGQDTGSVTINGGKFKSPEWSVKNIMNAYCGEGYKLKDNGEGWLVKTAIDYATLTVTKDGNVTAVVVSNGTEEVTLDGDGKAKFDKDDEVAVTVYPTFAANYELDTEKSSELTATMTADATINIVSKSAGPAPVEPGQDKVLEATTKEEAEAEIKNLVPAPTAEQIEDDITAADLQLVAVKRDGKWYAVAEPAAEYTPAVDTEAVKPIEVTDTDFKATVQTKKGFYYGFNECTTVDGTYAPAASFVKGDGTAMTLEAPKKEGATAEFFKLSVSAIPVTVTPVE